MWFVNDLIPEPFAINLDTVTNIETKYYCIKEFDDMVGQIFLTDKVNNQFKIFERLDSREGTHDVLDYCFYELIKAINSDKKIIYASDVFNLKNSE